MALVEKLSSRMAKESQWNTPLQPEFGFVESSMALIGRGASEESVIGVAADVASDAAARIKASFTNEPAMEKLAWEQAYGEDSSMTFVEGMPKSLWDVREERAIRSARSDFQ